jgi:hypothetical protein
MNKTSPNEIKQACNELAECMMVEHAIREEKLDCDKRERLAHSNTMAAKDALKDLSIW